MPAKRSSIQSSSSSSAGAGSSDSSGGSSLESFAFINGLKVYFDEPFLFADNWEVVPLTMAGGNGLPPENRSRIAPDDPNSSTSTSWRIVTSSSSRGKAAAPPLFLLDYTFLTAPDTQTPSSPPPLQLVLPQAHSTSEAMKVPLIQGHRYQVVQCRREHAVVAGPPLPSAAAVCDTGTSTAWSKEEQTGFARFLEDLRLHRQKKRLALPLVNEEDWDEDTVDPYRGDPATKPVITRTEGLEEEAAARRYRHLPAVYQAYYHSISSPTTSASSPHQQQGQQSSPGRGGGDSGVRIGEKVNRNKRDRSRHSTRVSHSRNRKRSRSI